jgi:acyl carrier protein
MDKDAIFNSLVDILDKTFEIDPSDVQLDADLYDDLDLDSIDAIDLVVKIQDVTGKKVKPEDFKSARSISDVVDIVHNLTAD